MINLKPGDYLKVRLKGLADIYEGTITYADNDIVCIKLFSQQNVTRCVKHENIFYYEIHQ